MAVGATTAAANAAATGSMSVDEAANSVMWD